MAGPWSPRRLPEGGFVRVAGNHSIYCFRPRGHPTLPWHSGGEGRLSGPPPHPGQASGRRGAALGLWGRAARRRHTGSSLEERWTHSKTEMDYLSLPIVPDPKYSFSELRTLPGRGGNSVSPPSRSQSWATLLLGGAPSSPGVPRFGRRTCRSPRYVAVSSTQSLFLRLRLPRLQQGRVLARGRRV